MKKSPQRHLVSEFFTKIHKKEFSSVGFGSIWSKLVQTGSMWIKQIQSDSKWFKSIQNKINLEQTGSMKTSKYSKFDESRK